VSRFKWFESIKRFNFLISSGYQLRRTKTSRCFHVWWTMSTDKTAEWREKRHFSVDKIRRQIRRQENVSCWNRHSGGVRGTLWLKKTTVSFERLSKKKTTGSKWIFRIVPELDSRLRWTCITIACPERRKTIASRSQSVVHASRQRCRVKSLMLRNDYLNYF